MPKLKYLLQSTKDLTDDEVNDFADEMIDWYKTPDNPEEVKNPNRKLWLGEFATLYSFPRRALKEFADRSEYFRKAYDYCMSMQEQRIILGGLNNSLNTIIVKAALANQHDWKERAEVEHVGNITLTSLVKEVANYKLRAPSDKDNPSRN